MRGVVRVMAWVSVLSACGGKASSTDATGSPEPAGGRDATGRGTTATTGGASASGGAPATGTGMVATGGRRASSGNWSAACRGGAEPLRLRRLTATDINRTLEDIFGPGETGLARPWPKLRGAAPRESATADDVRQLVYAAQERAGQYAEQNAADCGNSAVCAPRFAELGMRLFRRPLRDFELDSFEQLFDQVAAEADSQAGLAAVVEAMIESPYFTFRVETSSGGRWSDYTVAARLAYFLWRAGPDAALLDAAGTGDLSSNRDHVEQQVERMLDDPRAEYGYAALVREWLGLDPLYVVAGAAGPNGVVPASDMNQQTWHFLENAYVEGRATLDHLLLASSSPLNATLADYYRVPSDGLDAGFTDVELDPAKFSGILTHGSVLLTAPSPSTRGALLRQKLLCSEVGPPPPDETFPTEGSTRRELFESISSSAACRSCHQLLDPLGFALEGFDGFGAPQEGPVNGFVLGLDGVTNQTFDGPRGLGELLAKSRQVSRCVVRQFSEYALDGAAGQVRVLQADPELPPAPEPPPPAAPLECLAEAFLTEGGDLRALLSGLAQSDVFLRAGTDFELPPSQANARTPLEHAAHSAETLHQAAAAVLDDPLEIQSYAQALATLAEKQGL